MAVLTAVSCRLSVRSAAIPSAAGDSDPSPDPPPSPFSPPLTRVILPKKKPLKWSTGTAPGEYGGPPTTTKLRKYWGGGDLDPITATDDFIWNKDFVGHMKRFLSEEPEAPSPFLSPVVDILIVKFTWYEICLALGGGVKDMGKIMRSRLVA